MLYKIDNITMCGGRPDALVGLADTQAVPPDIAENLVVDNARNTFSYNHACVRVRSIPKWNVEIPLNNNTDISLLTNQDLKQNENDHLDLRTFILK